MIAVKMEDTKKFVPIVKVGMPPKHLLMPALEETLYSGIVAEGEKVYQFEREFGARFGISNALAMSSGTAALHASLVLAGVRPGDEVISTPMTAEPTNLSILHAGAKVVWADVSPFDGTIDPDSIRQRITPRTRAIVLVHYAGYPARMNEIMKIARHSRVPVIEDCAHALGAKYGGAPIGTLGHFAIFSFQAIKHMTTVDGGILVVGDRNQIQDAKKFRWFGMLKGESRTQLDIESLGYKYNMHNVAATIGLAQLSCIDKVLARHIENGQFYNAALSNIAGVRPAVFDEEAQPSYWLYTLCCEDSGNAERALKEAGIGASKLHKPNNRHAIFSSSARDLPGLDTFYRRLLHLPCGWWVTDQDRARIVDVLKRG